MCAQPVCVDVTRGGGPLAASEEAWRGRGQSRRSPSHEAPRRHTPLHAHTRRTAVSGVRRRTVVRSSDAPRVGGPPGGVPGVLPSSEFIMLLPLSDERAAASCNASRQRCRLKPIASSHRHGASASGGINALLSSPAAPVHAAAASASTRSSSLAKRAFSAVVAFAAARRCRDTASAASPFASSIATDSCCSSSARAEASNANRRRSDAISLCESWSSAVCRIVVACAAR